MKIRFSAVILLLLPLFAVLEWSCGEGKECYYDLDCPQGKVCKNNTCSNYLEVSCTEDKDCSKGLQCIKGACVTVPTGFKLPEPEPESGEFTEGKGAEGEGLAEKTADEPIPEEPATADEPTAEGPPETPEPEPDLGPQKCKLSIDCLGTNQTCTVDPKTGEAICKDKNSKGKKFGEACKNSSECASLICHPQRKVCTELCTADSHCPGRVCEKVKIANKNYSVCLAQDNQCLKDAQCSKPQICSLSFLGQKLVTRCTSPIGLAKVGETCGGDADCSHNICYNSEYCSQFCESDGDCPKNFLCREVNISSGSQNFKFKVCQIPAEGLPCKTDNDCKRTNYRCTPAAVNKKLELRCRYLSGNKMPGDSCKNNSDCYYGICLPNTKKCSISCSSDKDCANYSATPLCRDVSIEVNSVKGKMKFCVPNLTSCQKAGDCSADQTCVPFSDDTGQFAFKCLPANNNGKALGEDCNRNEECRSNICYQNRCSELCAQDGDCAGGKRGYVCSAASFQQGGQNLNGKLCLPPKGGLLCEKDADCPSKKRPLCKVVEGSNTLESRCSAQQAGLKATGATCKTDGECKYGTCLQPEFLCTKLCQKDSDCPQPMTCIQRTLVKNGKKGTFKVCALRRCQGDAECLPGQICAYISQGQNSFLACVVPDKKKSPYLASCQKDSQCQSGICHQTRQYCVPVCKTGKDDVCPPQFACETQPYGPNKLNLCAPLKDTCNRNADCTGGKLCVLSYDQFGRPLKLCSAPVGNRKVGEFCDPKASTPQCETGFCHPVTKRCSSFCNTDRDCPSQTTYQCVETQLSKRWKAKICRSLMCLYDGDCAKGEFCRLEIVNNKATKICSNRGGKKAGESCNFDYECSSNVCARQGSGNNKFCAALCEAKRHCKSNEKCVEITTFLGGKTKICQPGASNSCSGDADCQKGEICQANVNQQQNQLEGQCVKPRPLDKKVGESCTPNKFPGDCASHLCDPVTQKCVAMCQPGLNDCQGGQTCTKFSPFGNLQINACLPPPKSCTRQKDCPASTNCAPVLSQGKIQYLCVRQSPAQTKKIGETCDPKAVFPGECQTHLCHPTLKVCVETCQNDSDCPSARPRCGKIPLPNGLLARACVPSKSKCVRSDICPASEPVCVVEVVGNQFQGRCGTGGPGTKKIGEYCDPTIKYPGQCRNRFCEAGRMMCTAICETNSDCPKGLICGDTLLGNNNIKGCIPPEKSTCKKATDCALPMYCKAVKDLAGKVSGQCLRKGPNEKAYGDQCKPTAQSPTQNNKISKECATGICHPTTRRCSALCSRDSDCLSGRCKPFNLEGNSIKACDISCKKDSDCPTKQRCAIVPSTDPNKPYDFTCLVPLSKKKPTGSICDPNKIVVTNECQNFFCSRYDSKCNTLCESDADCPTGKYCLSTSITLAPGILASVNGCFSAPGSCKDSEHCTTGQICGIVKKSSKLLYNCITPDLTKKPLGQPCNPNRGLPSTECQSGICHPTEKVCTLLCTKDSQCAPPYSKCKKVSIGGSFYSVCSKP